MRVVSRRRFRKNDCTYDANKAPSPLTTNTLERFNDTNELIIITTPNNTPSKLVVISNNHFITIFFNIPSPNQHYKIILTQPSTTNLNNTVIVNKHKGSVDTSPKNNTRNSELYTRIIDEE